MIVYMFMEQFAANVQMGEKPCTIRPDGDKVPFVGQPVSLRRWSGKPYRSKQIELRQAYISRVRPIRIDSMGVVRLAGKKMGLDAMNTLAEQDGFESAHELLHWFSDQHGFPFKGIFIEWDDLPRLHEGCRASRIIYGRAGDPNNKWDIVTVLAIRGKYAMFKHDRCVPGVVPVRELTPVPYWGLQLPHPQHNC